MVRAALAVIVGYVAMALLVFATFSLAMLLLGTDRAFRPGTHDPSTLWLVTSFVLSFISAVVGGWICATIAKKSKAPLVFAALILGLGLLLAGYVMMMPDGERSSEGSAITGTSMQSGRQPIWVTVLNPVIAASGILLGARLKGRGKDS